MPLGRGVSARPDRAQPVLGAAEEDAQEGRRVCPSPSPLQGFVCNEEEDK